jgi:hypothetical protein
MSELYTTIAFIFFTVSMIAIFTARLSKNSEWFVGYSWGEMLIIAAIGSFVSIIWPVAVLLAIIVGLSKLIAFGIDKVIDTVNGTPNV